MIEGELNISEVLPLFTYREPVSIQVKHMLGESPGIWEIYVESRINKMNPLNVKGTVIIHTSLSCIHCGGEVSQYGPETFHTESTLIRCDISGDAKRATVESG